MAKRNNITEADIRFMREALKEASAAYDEGEVPIGAVIVSHGKIISRGHNQTERLNDATAHAEMIAITAASNYYGSKYLEECTLYVTIEPCVMCAGAILWSRIGRVVYGAVDVKAGYQSRCKNLLNKNIIILGNVLGDECAALIQQFFKERRNP